MTASTSQNYFWIRIKIKFSTLPLDHMQLRRASAAAWAGKAAIDVSQKQYTAHFSPIKSVGDPRVAKHTL